MSRSNRLYRHGLRAVAILCLALPLTLVFGRIVFAPWATDLLVRTTAAVGIYGIEDIEDFYMVGSFMVSIALAVLVVLAAESMVRRRAILRDR